MPKRTKAVNPLADRLDALGIAPEEVAGIIRRSVDEVGDWYSGDAAPDADAAVLLRFLDDDADALRRVEQVRRTHRANFQGEGVQYAGIQTPPYGTSDSGKATGGVPS